MAWNIALTHSSRYVCVCVCLSTSTISRWYSELYYLQRSYAAGISRK